MSQEAVNDANEDAKPRFGELRYDYGEIVSTGSIAQLTAVIAEVCGVPGSIALAAAILVDRGRGDQAMGMIARKAEERAEDREANKAKRGDRR